MMLSFPLLVLASLPFFSLGEKLPTGEQCDQANTKLQAGSYELSGDCGPTDYCASNGTCVPRGCRRDDFPFGYPKNSDFPPKCPTGMFCPDEQDVCQSLLPVGSKCQLNRDDQCQGPPDGQFSNFPFNVKGAVCLNNQCWWANVTENQPCELENVAYIAYTFDSEFAFVVSRGNCQPGLYCDASNPNARTCHKTKVLGAACTADKECDSNNCQEDSTCGVSADAAAHFPIWVYVAVGAGIIGGMIFTLTALFFVHRRTRDEEREKRTQYWREQTALRQNIMQLKDTARSGRVRDMQDPPSQIQSGDSQIPILPPKQNGFRHNNLSDDDRDEGEYPGLINTTVPRRRVSRPYKR